MNILVTGGAGFIGSHLIDRLLKEGSSVTCVDDLSLGNLKNLETCSQSKDFKFIELDLNEKLELNKIFSYSKIDMVYHMAANSDISKGTESTFTDLERTFLTTFNVVDCMKDNGVKRIFFPSTSAVYGDIDGKIAEESTKNPVSLYGSAKLSSEAFLQAYSYLFDIQVWVLRLANVIGPRTTHGVIFDFIKKLQMNPKKLEVLGNGTQNKPYIHVADLIDCILFIIENSNSSFNEYNVAPTETTTVRDIAELTSKFFGNDPQIIYEKQVAGWKGDIVSYNYDTKKLNELGWFLENSSYSAVQRTLEEISNIN